MRGDASENAYVEKVKKFHDRDADNYAKNRYGTENITQLGYKFRREIAAKMMETVEGRMLDVGCGPGTLIDTLSSEKRNMFACDLSIEMVREAKRGRQGDGRSQFLVSNLMKLGFKGGVFDGVVCIGVFGYLPSPNEALQEIRRVMKDGGAAVIQTSNAASIKEKLYEKWIPAVKKTLGLQKTKSWGFDFPLFSYSRNDFDRMVEANGFQIVDWDLYDFHFPFLERFSMKATMGVARWLQKHSKKGIIRFLGSGYLVKIRKRQA